MGKYDEVSVVKALSKNPDIRIKGNHIEIVKDSQYIGNGSWGKIDFLTHYCGYVRTTIDRDAILAEKAAAQAARKEYEKEKKIAKAMEAAAKIAKAAKAAKANSRKDMKIPISVL